nr:MAG TPA: hypothetical protein [Caudoviricetes sp.]
MLLLMIQVLTHRYQQIRVKLQYLALLQINRAT